jgi:putative endonuclease
MTTRKSPWTVYVLRCGDGTLYTGITNNLEGRLAAHRKGVASKYTRSRLPVELVLDEAAGSRGEALKREAQIKRLSRMRKLELIDTVMASDR